MPRPARPWFRFYVEAVHDRKLRRLKPEYRWLFVACLAAARSSPTPGVLLVGENDPMQVEDLADVAGMTAVSVRAGLAALCAAGVLSYDEDRWSVPAWSERQYESDDVSKRTAKHRSKERSNVVPTDPETDDEEDRRNVPTSFPGTPPDTETETDTESAPMNGADKQAKPHKRRTRVPDPFEVSTCLRDWAATKGLHVDLDRETEKFVNYHASKGTLNLSWDGAWRNWMLKAEEFAGSRNGKPADDFDVPSWTDLP